MQHRSTRTLLAALSLAYAVVPSLYDAVSDAIEYEQLPTHVSWLPLFPFVLMVAWSVAAAWRWMGRRTPTTHEADPAWRWIAAGVRGLWWLGLALCFLWFWMVDLRFAAFAWLLLCVPLGAALAGGARWAVLRCWRQVRPESVVWAAGAGAAAGVWWMWGSMVVRMQSLGCGPTVSLAYEMTLLLTMVWMCAAPWVVGGGRTSLIRR